jgi:hypothetical protein
MHQNMFAQIARKIFSEKTVHVAWFVIVANFDKPFESQNESAWRLSPYLAENISLIMFIPVH